MSKRHFQLWFIIRISYSSEALHCLLMVVGTPILNAMCSASSRPLQTFLFRLTAICRNARHRTHKKISATTHSITSGHSTNQITTGLCSWGRSPPFRLAVPTHVP